MVKRLLYTWLAALLAATTSSHSRPRLAAPGAAAPTLPAAAFPAAAFPAAAALAFGLAVGASAGAFPPPAAGASAPDEAVALLAPSLGSAASFAPFFLALAAAFLAASLCSSFSRAW